MHRCLSLAAALIIAAGCNGRPLDADAVECGVALLVESDNAKANGSHSLANQLGPVIEWHRQRGGELPAELRSEDRAIALMHQYQVDPRNRKSVAKACVTAAYQDPGFRNSVPRAQ